MNSGLLLSIQSGLPRLHRVETPMDSRDPQWVTGFYKESCVGSRWVSQTQIEGDGQADLHNHGGPDKAINVYPSEHYAYWRDRFPHLEMEHGGFGENFTTQGLAEQSVYIGDRFQIGEAVVQISQPRQPCWKLSRRWGIPDFAIQVETSGFTGWYFRVLQEGHVEANSPIQWLEGVTPTMTVTQANKVMHTLRKDRQATEKLLACPALSQSWSDVLNKRLKSLP
jgi:MOSC domain-containing protein YiiM